MDTIFVIIIIPVIIGLIVIGLKNSANPKHDFSGDLEKEKEDYELSFLKFMDDIKSIFNNKK